MEARSRRARISGLCAVVLPALLAAAPAAAGEPAQGAEERASAANIAERVRALAGRMASDEYAEREKASAEAGKLPVEALKLLLDLARTHEDPEAQWRCEEAASLLHWNAFLSTNEIIDYAGNEAVRKLMNKEANLTRSNTPYSSLHIFLLRSKPVCMLMPQGLGRRAQVLGLQSPLAKTRAKPEDVLRQILTAARCRARVGKALQQGQVKRIPIYIFGYEEDLDALLKGVPGGRARQGIQMNEAGGFVIRAGVRAGAPDAKEPKKAAKPKKPDAGRKPEKKGDASKEKDEGAKKAPAPGRDASGAEGDPTTH